MVPSGQRPADRGVTIRPLRRYPATGRVPAVPIWRSRYHPHHSGLQGRGAVDQTYGLPTGHDRGGLTEGPRFSLPRDRRGRPSHKHRRAARLSTGEAAAFRLVHPARTLTG